MTRTIRLPKPADPFQSEIDRRIALKKAASKRDPVPATIIGPAALRDLSAYMKANTVSILVVEVR